MSKPYTQLHKIIKLSVNSQISLTNEIRREEKRKIVNKAYFLRNSSTQMILSYKDSLNSLKKIEYGK